MAIAYWCIVLTAFLPYVWVTIGESAAKGYDNRNPRGWVAEQTHPRVQRGNAAHLNAFEAFAPFTSSTVEAAAGLSAPSYWKMKTASGLFSASRVTVPVSDPAAVEWCTPAWKVRPTRTPSCLQPPSGAASQTSRA